MNKVLVYPFDREFAPILRHRSLLGNFSILKLASPPGWALDGKDASASDGGDATGYIVESDFENAINECDALLLTNSANLLNYDSTIFPQISIAACKGKKIYCMRDMADNELRSIIDCCDENHVEFHGNTKYPVNTTPMQELYDISTPVVFVLGVSARADKFEIQLVLREELIKRQYKVSQIGSRSNCELLGFHSMPTFMTDNGISENDKIILFNHFVKRIELQEQPDLILIGIPGGVFPFNTMLTNNFGITAFEISQALLPDYSIFSSFYEEYYVEYFDSVSNDIQKRLGFPIDCHNIANTKIDWMESKAMKKLSYLTLDALFVSGRIKRYGTTHSNIVTIFEQNAAEKMVDSLIDKLSGYAYAKSM